MIDLVIFDCDGVLVDSEVLVTEIESEMLTALGAAMTPEDVARNFVGLSEADMTEALRRDFSVELPADFDEDRRTRVAARFEEALQPVADIDAVLGALPTPKCVASSSSPERIASSLSITGLLDHFDGRLYSTSMVPRGKPAPDVFLHAARAFATPPHRCAVIEDSPHGVTAGRAAGMRVIGFTAGRHCSADHAERLTAAGANQIANTSAELGDMLRTLTQGIW